MIKEELDSLIKEGEEVILKARSALNRPYTIEVFKGAEYEMWISKCELVLHKYFKDDPIVNKFKDASSKAVGNGKKYYETMRGVLMALRDKCDIINQGEKVLKKPRKIFVSHCSKDRKCTDKFVDLLKGMGVKNTQIYYSSYEETGAGFLQDCLESIEKEFNNNELLIIFMLSRAFYNSKVCLAETGAAWVSVGNKYIPIIIPPFEYDDITGVIKGSQNAIDLGSEELSTKLEHFKLTVEEFLNIEEKVDNSEWTRKKDEFIKLMRDKKSEIKELEFNIKDIKINKKEATFKIYIENNTKDRIRLETANINIALKENKNKEVKINGWLLNSIVVQPLEMITIYLNADIDETIKRSDIEINNSYIIVDYYSEE